MFFYEENLFGDENTYAANIIESFNFHSHFHRSYELICILDGETEICVDDKTYIAKKDDIVLIFPNQIHSFTPIGYSKICLGIFSPEMVGQFFAEYNNLVPKSNVVKNSDVSAEEMLTDNVYLQKAVLYKALGKLINSTDFEKANISGDFKLIHRILTFIEDHYSETCSLKEVSRVLKYDYAYLSKRFVKTMNMSYTEYLNRYRISRACYLIDSERMAISDIYVKCGFENARSFNRNFKKYTGVTPSKFKATV